MLAMAKPMLLALLVSGSIAIAASANDYSAVSGPNGKVGIEGGTFDDTGAGIASGSLSLPLGHTFGLQADGALGSIDGQIMGGGGLHLFTRDPSSYLLGVFGSYHTWDSIGIWRVAGEAELYLQRFTLSGLAGYEYIDFPRLSDGLAVLNKDDSSFFGHFDAAYYITDNFKVSAGYRYVSEMSLGSAGAEYLISGTDVPVSLFARSDFGRSDYASITGGLKIYLSGDNNKSLIDRNRQDDPEAYLPVFPKIVKAQSTPAPAGPNYCSVDGSHHERVLAGAPNCICPMTGSFNEGNPPIDDTADHGVYRCGNPL